MSAELRWTGEQAQAIEETGDALLAADGIAAIGTIHGFCGDLPARPPADAVTGSRSRPR